jgi:hypothetical protein
MFAKAVDNTELPRPSNTPTRSILAWLKPFTEARRAKRAHSHALQEVRHLDRSMREDIGLGYSEFIESGPGPAECNPHALAIGRVCGSRSGWR